MKHHSIVFLMSVVAVLLVFSACAGSDSGLVNEDGDSDIDNTAESDAEGATEAGEEKGFEWEDWPLAQRDDIDRPEHPDPAFARRDWLNLNGTWDFTFDADDRGLTENWAAGDHTFEQRINVPFCWSSPLSGIAVETGDDGGIGWYRRSFTLPESFAGRRSLLVIGAADWDVSLFINGRQVLLHAASGYLPLKTDISDYLKDSSNEIVVRVQDFGNAADYPHGKQGAPWYANIGGIWQTVYVEAVAATRFESIRLTPDVVKRGFRADVAFEGEPPESCSLAVYARDQPAAVLMADGISDGEFSADIATPWLENWSPENPVLQEFEWHLTCDGESDVVRTYSGLRSVSRAVLPGLDYEAVHINGAPTYIRGVLVQGYNPQGHYTYPSEEYMVNDLEAARKAGFNMVRLHIKVEEPLLLYHADRLGLLVDYDVPCYGAFPFETGDGPEARARWQTTMEGQFRRDFNHPSVIWWTLFNEDWGLISLTEDFSSEKQAFVKSMLVRARELDPSRLIEDHSTLRYDHVSGTDVNSFHIYMDDPYAFKEDILEWVEGCEPGSEHNFIAGEKQDGAPLLNTEYGPFSAENGAPEWKRNRDISWGFQMLTSIMRSQSKLVGYIFTELYDVEFELNGVVNYERAEKDFGYPLAGGPAALNGADFVGFVEPYFQIAQGGKSLLVTPFISSFSAADGTDVAIEDKLDLTLLDAAGRKVDEKSMKAVCRQWQATEQAAVEFEVPDDMRGAAYVLAIWSRGDKTIASNYLPGEIIAAAPQAVDCSEKQCTVALDLAACSGPLDAGSIVAVAGETQSTGFIGGGVLTCSLTIPAQLPGDRPVSVWFEAEASQNVSGSPQTMKDTTTAGIAAQVRLDNTGLGTLELPPERADSRGVLSHLNGTLPRGAYGNLLSSVAVQAMLAPGSDAVLSIEVSVSEGNYGGLLLLGRRLGRYGQTPTLHFSWE